MARTGFISYSHQQSGWVATLHANLEQCGWTLFLDQMDLSPGRSWVQQIQAGMDQGSRLILVATPDSLASPRVLDEWGGFIAEHPEWKQLGLLQVVRLLWAPLPPFLEDLQFVDFRNHDTPAYRLRLADLLAGLAGVSRRHRPQLPAGLTVPAAPQPATGDQLRRDLVELLAPCLESEDGRRRVAGLLGIEAASLAGFPSRACAASAALVLAGENGDPHGTATKAYEAVRTRSLDSLAAKKLQRLKEALADPGHWQQARSL